MSAKDNQIPVRLSDNEKKKLEEAANEAGFKNVSEYVRYMTIGEGRAIDAKLDIIDAKLNEILNKLKK